MEPNIGCTQGCACNLNIAHKFVRYDGMGINGLLINIKIKDLTPIAPIILKMLLVADNVIVVYMSQKYLRELYGALLDFNFM